MKARLVLQARYWISIKIRFKEEQGILLSADGGLRLCMANFGGVPYAEDSSL
jgi:hypothetical protein